jgi:hypothetical protein
MSSAFTPSVVGAFSARNIVGDTSGTATPAGVPGENYTDSSSTFFTTSPANIISRTLQPGVWRIAAYTAINSGAVINTMNMSISSTSATQNTANMANIYGGAGTGNAAGNTEIIVNISVATVYYLVGQSSATVTSSQTTRLICQRIG